MVNRLRPPQKCYLISGGMEGRPNQNTWSVTFDEHWEPQNCLTAYTRWIARQSRTAFQVARASMHCALQWDQSGYGRAVRIDWLRVFIWYRLVSQLLFHVFRIAAGRHSKSFFFFGNHAQQYVAPSALVQNLFPRIFASHWAIYSSASDLRDAGVTGLRDTGMCRFMQRLSRGLYQLNHLRHAVYARICTS